ncbi:MAG: phospho-N-acetylmuramoyl-pentapeptide-transferase [Deltaproteobacteria bacterium CG11_big_fil_rev_8_21_14_0_20_47_16]|nr:MAG: phospho-N-acetylmuramoyl-pentapeptide-transferase [Deltaproteobacteria bacterium CG11_big_fil_rev_8_21_14_0_20_47_16]
MLYYYLYPLRDTFIGFNVFRYITFRTFGALLTSMVIYFIFGRFFINYLRKLQFMQSIRNDGPATHLQKGGTPTMGGVLMWLGVLVSVGLWGEWNIYVALVIGIGFAYAMIGFLDDYRKVILRDPNGLASRYKFLLQMAGAIIPMIILFDGIGFDTHLIVPFLKTVTPDLGVVGYIVFSVLVIVGASNAVNLTDGLDGLVAVPSIVSFSTYAIFAYVVGNAVIANYLQLQFIPGVGELAVICGAIIGGCIGFLWFNAHPAEIFMGDVGALPLGGVLGAIAVLTKQEILLLLVGGIFVLETVSVIVQVISFKLTGKRVFRMAPIHHHFELKGWKESKVIVRFWIIAMILAILSLGTLKLR